MFQNIFNSTQGVFQKSNGKSSNKKTKKQFNSKSHDHVKNQFLINSNTRKTKKNVLQLPRNTIKIIQSLKGLGTDGWIDEDPNLTKVIKITKNNNKSMDEPHSIINSETKIEENKYQENSETCLENICKAEEALRNREYSIENIPFKKKTIANDKSNSLEEMESNDNENSTSENVSCDSFEKSMSFSSQEWINQVPSQSEIEEDCLKNLELEEAAIVNDEKEDALLLPSKLHREASVQSNSSLDPIFDLRRPDPVEIFLNLGFGSIPGIDMENCRIPKRFMVPSKCKGGDWNEFLRRELIQAQNFECSSLGFRGLSGPSHRRPSAIVANIMEKLRERSVAQTQTRSTFTEVAKKVLNEKSVLNKMLPDFQSVLSPDNRKFLENQGKISPEVPRRKIIFGQKSFAFAGNGELVEVESESVPISSEENESSNVLTKTNDSEEKATSAALQNDALYKLRRSSLKKQSKVEEDSDPDDFYVVKKKENSEESKPFYDSIQCLKKKEKIPRRFLSYSNIKNVNVKSSFSETMRSEVEKEINYLSTKIKAMSDEDLASVLKHVKQLRSALEENAAEV